MTRPANQQFRLGRRPNPARNARVVELYQAGMSSTEVGRRVGMTAQNVINILRRAGVPLRSRRESVQNGIRRAARLRLIAEAAQRMFGHLRAPGVAEAARAAKLPPVNAMFEDAVIELGWEDMP